MYVKIFNRILDSSLADNPKLRHFFMDFLLLADPDGNVIMTKEAIKARLRLDTVADVEWGLAELQKPDALSLTTTHSGRRIEPLDGHGYGWKIINFETYRDFKTSKEMREATKLRVQKYRESKKGMPLNGEAEYLRAQDAGQHELAEIILKNHTPKCCL